MFLIMNEFKKFARLSLLGFALVSVMGTGIIACSDDTETSSSSSSLSGSVAIDGSSTVYPVEEAVAEEFGKLHPDVKVTVGQSGTGGGFKKFCAGETDVSGASRNIKDTEAALCAENNIKLIKMLKFPLFNSLSSLTYLEKSPKFTIKIEK